MRFKIPSFKQRNQRNWMWGGNQFVAFFISLAVILTPLQFPFLNGENTEDTEANDVTSISPIEYYESHTKTEAPVTFTYRKGEELPAPTENVVPAEVAISIPSPLVAAIDIPLPLPDTDTQKSYVRRPSHNNEIAAAQVAEGMSASELVAVTLDTHANVVATEDSHGNTTEAEYNEVGQPIKIINPDGTTSFFAYDVDGNLTGITRSEGAITQSRFLNTFAFLKPLFATADDTEDISIAYDAGNPSTIEGAGGTMQYAYDTEGLLISEYRSDGSAVEYSYDELGNVVSSTETKETNGSFSFNSLFSWSFARAPQYAYTQTAAYNDDNRLDTFSIFKDAAIIAEEVAPPQVITPITEPIIEINVPAEPVPAPIQEPILETPEIAPVDAALGEIISSFTHSVNAVFALVHSFLSFTYAEDTAVTAVSEQIVPTPLFSMSYKYDLFGNVTETNTNNGLTTAYTYTDTTNSIQSKTVAKAGVPLLSYTYSSDSKARLRAINGISYAYTDGGLLERAGNEEYTYDEHGNRMTKGSVTYTYEGNRLTQVAYPDGRTTAYAYNENGAVLESIDSEKGTCAFTYTTSGAIESIKTADDTISYTYNALGERTSRTSSRTGTQNYGYIGGKLKTVTDAEGGTLREYFYSPKNELVAVQIGNTLHTIVTDHTESVVALIAQDTGVVRTQSYDVWGNVTQSDFGNDVDLGYVGAFSEPSLDLSILGPRVYNPEIGRFLSKDPLPGVIIDTLSQNEYIYAKNDPVNQYDPSGHESVLADKSTSPKRALAETNTAITELKAQLRDAEALVTALAGAEDTDALFEVETNVTTLTTSLAILKSIRDDQEREIAESVAAAQINIVDTATTSVAMPPATSTESLPLEITSTSTIEILTPDIATATGTVEIKTVIETVPPLAPVPEEVPVILPVPSDPVIESVSTPTLSETIIVSFLVDILRSAKDFAYDHLSKAEAKSKKSKAKDKKKQKANEKAKKKQQEEAKKIAKLNTKVDTLKKQLVGLLNTKINTLKGELAVAKEKKRNASAGSAVRNIAAVAKNQEAQLNFAPYKPAFTTVRVGTSAGITSPQSTQMQVHNLGVQNLLNMHTAHMVLTACGFEPTLIGASCGILDGTLYLFEGKWGDAGLSVFAAIPVAGVMGDSAKMARLAAEAGEKALVTAKAIKIPDERMVHIIAGHTLGGTATLGKSIFNDGVDVQNLIKQSEQIPAIKQTMGSNYERIFDTGKNIGIDRATGLSTRIVTVITNAANELVTAFPGRP